MTQIIIDPYIYSCPSLDQKESDFVTFISNLLLWREIKDNNWKCVFNTIAAAEVLAETNSYPPQEHLKEIIAKYDIKDIQAKDIVNLINALLLQLPNIEDKFGLFELLFDKYISSPYLHLTARPDAFKIAYERLTSIVSLSRTLLELPEKSLIVITKELNTDWVESDISCDIHDYEHDENIKRVNCPIHVKEIIPICQKPEALYLNLNPVIMWLSANSEEEYTKSIEIQMSQIIGSTDDLSNYKWGYNSDFFDSAKPYGFLHNEMRAKMLLRACAETILSTNLKDTHALRTGSGANNPQRKRRSDHAKAYRRDIDHEYHLHYWETEFGVELANVVVHNNMSISE